MIKYVLAIAILASSASGYIQSQILSRFGSVRRGVSAPPLLQRQGGGLVTLVSARRQQSKPAIVACAEGDWDKAQIEYFQEGGGIDEKKELGRVEEVPLVHPHTGHAPTHNLVCILPVSLTRKYMFPCDLVCMHESNTWSSA